MFPSKETIGSGNRGSAKRKLDDLTEDSKTSYDQDDTDNDTTSSDSDNDQDDSDDTEGEEIDRIMDLISSEDDSSEDDSEEELMDTSKMNKAKHGKKRYPGVNIDIRKDSPRVYDQKDQRTCFAVSISDAVGTIHRKLGGAGPQLQLSAQPLIDSGVFRKSIRRMDIFLRVYGLPDLRSYPYFGMEAPKGWSWKRYRKSKYKKYTIRGLTRVWRDDFISEDHGIENFNETGALIDVLNDNFGVGGKNLPLVGNMDFKHLLDPKEALYYAHDETDPYHHLPSEDESEDESEDSSEDSSEESSEEEAEEEPKEEEPKEAGEELEEAEITPNHAVLIMGLNTMATDSYRHYSWIKNSHGKEWAKDGFTQVGLDAFDAIYVPKWEYPQEAHEQLKKQRISSPVSQIHSKSLAKCTMMSETALQDLNLLTESERTNETSDSGAVDVEMEYIDFANLGDVEDVDKSLKVLIPGLESKDWVLLCETLNNVRRLSLYHKEALQDQLENVITLVVKALKNPRSAVCKTAIMTSADIFKAFGDSMIDLLDPLLVVLLLKSSEDKHFVCEAVETALTALTIWVSPDLLLPKLHTYLKNSNPRIRATALLCISRSVPRLGAEGIKNYRIDKLIQIASSQLNDQLPEARDAARTLLLELQTAYEKAPVLAPEQDTESQVYSWEQFCESNLPKLSAQAVLRVTRVAREGHDSVSFSVDANTDCHCAVQEESELEISAPKLGVMLEKLALSSHQPVISPDHLQVPDSFASQFTFGSGSNQYVSSTAEEGVFQVLPSENELSLERENTKLESTPPTTGYMPHVIGPHFVQLGVPELQADDSQVGGAAAGRDAPVLEPNYIHNFPQGQESQDMAFSPLQARLYPMMTSQSTVRPLVYPSSTSGISGNVELALQPPGSYHPSQHAPNRETSRL